MSSTTLRNFLRPTLQLSLAASALVLTACAGESTTKQDADSAPTAKETSVASGAVVMAELSTATSVRGCTVDDEGNVQPDEGAESELDASGEFSLDVSADNELYVIEALDSDGEVVGMAVLESTGSADSSVTTTPIDEESTVEASTFIRVISETNNKYGWSYADIRERIGAELSAAVYGSWEADRGDSEDIDLLADSIMVAQEAELLAWSDFGGSYDSDQHWEDELDASAELSAALYAAVTAGSDDTDDAHEAHEQFASELRVAAQAATDLSIEALSEACTTSWYAYSTAVEAQAGAESSISEGVKIAWGEGQSTRSDEVVVDMIAQINATLEGEAESAGDELESDAYAATELEAMTSAWIEYGNSVIGDGSGDAALTSALGIDIISEAAYEQAADECRTGAFQLYADLVAEAESSLSSDASYGELMAFAQASADARADYRSDVESAASDLEGWLSSSSTTEAAVMAMLAADGSFVGNASR